MMLRKREDLILRAGLDEKQAKAAGDRVRRQLEKLYDNVFARLQALIRDSSLYSKTETLDLAVAQKVISDLNSILVSSGLEDVVGSFLDEFPGLARGTRKYFEAFGDVPKLSGASAESINAYVTFAEVKLRDTVDAKLVEPLREGIFQVTFGQQPRDAVIAALESRADNLSPEQLDTLVDDSFRQFQRHVTNVTAEDLNMDIFWYQGPDDERTSDICNEILDGGEHGVSGMYYRDEIDAGMVDGLRGDPLIAGGHPNCRHKFYPISRDFALSQGFKP